MKTHHGWRVSVHDPPPPLATQHRCGTGRHGREPEQHMDADNAEKRWVAGRDRDPQNQCCVLGSHADQGAAAGRPFSTQARRIKPPYTSYIHVACPCSAGVPAKCS